MKNYALLLLFCFSSVVFSGEPIKCEHTQEEMLDALLEMRNGLDRNEDIDKIYSKLVGTTLLGKYEISLNPPFETDVNKVEIVSGCELSLSYCRQRFLGCKIPLLSGSGNCDINILKCVE